jgi:hypothetical protein
MKTINIVASIILVFINIHTKAQEPASSKENTLNTVLINCSFGIGTFAAGENVGGSAFFGSSLSADWMPNKKSGLTFGLESGLLRGESQGNIIYGIPAILRFGWYPLFSKNEKIDFFVLAKTGWGFGIWDSLIDEDTKPNGIVGGFNFGSRFFLSPGIYFYAELGYTYYGLSRSSKHPEYPLGYGSGKLYASFGLSFKIENH